MHSIKEQGIEILLEEAFAHIKNDMHEKFQSLALRNAKLRGVSTAHFLWEGIVYPTKNVTGVLHTKVAIPGLPTLHPTLLEELDETNNMMDAAGYHFVKNFFAAVLSVTYSTEVMDDLLPPFLISRLKAILTFGEYQSLSLGINGRTNYKPSCDSLNAVVTIKEHYADTIIRLRELLMDNFLLQ